MHQKERKKGKKEKEKTLSENTNLHGCLITGWPCPIQYPGLTNDDH